MMLEKGEVMVAATDNRTLLLDAQCWQCGQTFTVMVNNEDMVDWLSGSGPIEQILHYLTAGERELLISNTCGQCFDNLFSGLDNDE
jgi:hypothetical protein